MNGRINTGAEGEIFELHPEAVAVALVSLEKQYLHDPDDNFRPNRAGFRFTAGGRDVVFRPLVQILPRLGKSVWASNPREKIQFRVPPVEKVLPVVVEISAKARDRFDHILSGQDNGMSPDEARAWVDAAERIRGFIKVLN